MNLLTEKEKVIETCLSNMIKGNVRFVAFGHGWCIGFLEGRIFIRNCKKWRELYEKSDVSEEFKKLTDKIYEKLLEFRIAGLIQGEFLEYDKIIREKDKEISTLNDQVNSLQDEKTQIRKENIMLSNELEDRKNLIDSYESSSVKRK